jgi:ribosomal protein S27AE
MESREFAKMIPNPFPKPESVMAPRPESELKRTREEWQQKSKGQPQEGGDVGVEASANETLTVYAAEPMSEPTFELEKFMSPAEYQELQKMLDMRERTWAEISKREERNIQEGLPAYSNIDYSEVEVINQKIQQYQEVAKGRKGGETLPETPEVGKPATPGMPELPEEPTLPMPEEGAGVLEKRPLPEFASRKKVMDKQAVTSTDIPHTCKNCKALVVPAGYNELTFLDHKVKPFCTVSDGNLRIGFRYAFARECRGYDPIMKEMVQKSNPDNTETIFEELKERGEQPILKKNASEKCPQCGESTIDIDKKDGEKYCTKCDYEPGATEEKATKQIGKDIIKKNASLNKKATSVEGYVCPDCGSEKSRYLDCEDCRKKGIPCDEVVCTECGATAHPKKTGKKKSAGVDENKCPVCGGNLEDVGSYKWDCPKGCLPTAMELGQIQDMKTEKDGKMSDIKKTAEYDDKPMSKPIPIDTKEEADERGKKICPKCFEQGYFQPRGEIHPVHDWHSLWNIDFNSVAHNKDGVCLPKSMAYQSEMAGGPNQFDTERNRIVKEEK